jgi:uncharacterized protein (DUF488 family)
MILYTIGFTQKRAETFFTLLSEHGIQRLVDIRLKPGGQLSGFAKQDDLPYFLEHLANGCHYVHMPVLAPSQEILEDYRQDKNWQRYALRFEALMDERQIPEALERDGFEHQIACLLCSEATADQCHRRLVAERIAAHWPDVEITHL